MEHFMCLLLASARYPSWLIYIYLHAIGVWGWMRSSASSKTTAQAHVDEIHRRMFLYLKA